jgi:hypothetical protein
MIYFAYFHSIMKYGIIFWGYHTDSIRVFQLQKRVVRIMTGARSTASSKPLFKALEILTLPSQYILSLMTFLVHELQYFTFNFSIHNINTRKKLQLHRPTANFASFQTVVYYVGIKIFNILPECITNMVMNKKHFTLALKRFLIIQSFMFVFLFVNLSICSVLCLVTTCVIMYRLYYDLFHIQMPYSKLMDQWNAYVCMYVCTLSLPTIGCTSNQKMATFFHIPLNSLFINYHVITCYIT